MKEVKFQVWDSYKKEWIEDFCLLSNGEVLGMDKRMNVIFLVSIGADRRYIKRQYVGLKDVNEREIFEGDIVNCFKSHPSVVCSKMHAFGLDTRGRGFEPFYDIYGQCEIIGNVYENPELLEK